jgi:hypothetical protein
MLQDLQQAFTWVPKKGVSFSDEVAEIINRLPKEKGIYKLQLMTLKALRIAYRMTTKTAGRRVVKATKIGKALLSSPTNGFINLFVGSVLEPRRSLWLRGLVGQPHPYLSIIVKSSKRPRIDDRLIIKMTSYCTCY